MPRKISLSDSAREALEWLQEDPKNRRYKIKNGVAVRQIKVDNQWRDYLFGTTGAALMNQLMSMGYVVYRFIGRTYKLKQ